MKLFIPVITTFFTCDGALRLVAIRFDSIMRTRHAHAHLLFLLLIFLLSFISGDSSQAASQQNFTPLRINCGGGNIKDPRTGVLWRSDKDYVRKGKKFKFGDRYFTGKKFKGEAPLDVYQTVRRANISYRFGRVPDGRYQVRLHFIDAKELAKRSMDFWIEGVHLVHNLNVREAAGGPCKPYVYEAIIDVKGGNGLQIKGTRGHGDDVFLSAIEILAAPKDSTLTAVPVPEEHAPADLAAQLRQFAGGPLRAVWTRAADEEDFTMQRGSGTLYGFDTEDGRGERVILPGLRSFALPLLTPDGQRVVFTDQQQGKCYAVGFDGSGLRELADGFASHVWLDPQTGRTWVYVRSGWRDVKAPMLRYDLDDVKVKEIVWEQSANGSPPVSWFRVSGDGRYSVDTLPWPQFGLIDNTTGDFKILGKGCWPSVAPDSSGRTFLFSGNHTTIRFFEENDAEGHVVDLATVPGWTGRKVYHPRWTHDTRFITATAPQWMPETEFYIGRFNAGFTEIEKWFRVTYNSEADFFGDAWFASSQPVLAKKTSPNESSTKTEEPLDTLTTGLVFIWENERARNVILDANGKAKKAWSVSYDGGTRPNRWYGADIRQGSVLPSEDAAEAIGKSLAVSQAFSFSIDIPTFDAIQEKGAVVAYLGNPDAGWAFTINQEESGFSASLTTTDGKSLTLPFGGVNDHRAKQLLLTCADGMIKTYLNGKEVATVAATVDLVKWKPTKFIFGRSAPGSGFWKGSVENIRVYDHALGAADAARLFERSQQNWQQRKPLPTIVVEAELLQSSEPEDPETIAPYTRSLGENVYRVTKVLSGEIKEGDQIVVLQWVILGARVLDSSNREEGDIYKLKLEPAEGHPELSGEHRSTDIFDVTSAVYYDVGD